MASPSPIASHRIEGFTLLELLVAVALMAVIAVLGWRGLDAVIGARDDITRNTDRLRGLSLAFAQIEDDLRRAWFARLLVPGETVIALREPDPGRIELELLRPAPVSRAAAAAESLPMEGAPGWSSAPSSAPLQRVVWRLNDGRLERGQQGWMPGGAAVGDWAWQPLVFGLETIQWRLWIEGQGWTVSVTPATPTAPARNATSATGGAAPPAAPPGIVARPASGLEITLSGQGERLVRVLAARD
jgi:general secretion pathway protein J